MCSLQRVQSPGCGLRSPQGNEMAFAIKCRVMSRAFLPDGRPEVRPSDSELPPSFGLEAGFQFSSPQK